MAEALGLVSSCLTIIELSAKIVGCAIILDTNQQITLSKFSTATGASYNSHQNEHAPRCHPDTRLDLLSQIRQWAQDPQTKPLYWLNGMAGTGKSTISRTLAEAFASKGTLGATFFFKRGEHDRSASTLLFSTIAYQFAYAYPAALPHIIQAIEAEPSISQKPLKEQFQKLVVGPLSQLQTQSRNLIIIIDALDECDSDQDIRIIISAFTQANNLNSARLKVLVTSRPELPIRLGFSGYEGVYDTLILHEVPPLHVEADLFIYLMHEAKLIRDSFNRTVPTHRHISLDWPNPLQIAILARSASPLFIIAATMMRIIGDRILGSPDDQLSKILQDLTVHNDIGGNISATYMSALSPLIAHRSGRDKDHILQQFRAIIGPLVLLQTPPSIECLGRLLDIPHKLIDQILDSLHSVLSVPNTPDGVVRLFHLSFRDFLLNAEDPSNADFRINEADTHKELAFQCLDLLTTRTPLKKNICNFQWPGTSCCGISTEFKMQYLPAEVQYACLYWVHHLKNSQVQIHDGDRVHEFLRVHFLHWLEALGILGRVSETITQISMLQSLAQFESASEVLSFLEDARRFVLAYRHIAAQSPLQLYSSALIFSPVNSVIRQTFAEDIPAYVTLLPKVDDDWSAALMALEGHRNMVFDAVFSPDSRLLASASDDATVRIWEADTGEHLQTLEGHDSSVYSVAFSHDSKFLASASKDCTVRLWSVQTGDQLKTFTGHNNTVRTVVFSPDSRTLISGSDDSYVRVWSVETATAIHTLEGHHSSVEVCACSPNGSLVASGSMDDYVRVWSIRNGQHVRSLGNHERGVTSVAFSSDSSRIASTSRNGTVRIWSVEAGCCLQVYNEQQDHISSATWSLDLKMMSMTSSRDIHFHQFSPTEQIWDINAHAATSAHFSPDSRLIASGSFDGCVRIWSTAPRASTGASEDQILSVDFALNSNLIAARSSKGISLWSADTGDRLPLLEGCIEWGKMTEFSPDATLLAAASADGLVRIWSTVTGKCLYTLVSASTHPRSLAFSADSNRLVIMHKNGIIEGWKWDKGTYERIFLRCYDLPKFRSLAVGPDMEFLALTVEKGILVWEVGDYNYLLRANGFARFIAFSQDSELVASVHGTSGYINVWSVRTRQRLKQIPLPCDIYNLSFSPDNTTLYTTSGPFSLDETTRVASGSILSSESTQSDNDIPNNASPGCLSLTPTGVAETNGKFSLSEDRSWIQYAGQNLLWLPSESRPRDGYFGELFCVIGESTVILGCSIKEIMVIRFSNQWL
ncbi:hypothetical protein CEP53_004824 [Fusarium sp. AF-6]|nr:hypothetical protein CEP53_004824 [Fusarium sp. AF-6]